MRELNSIEEVKKELKRLAAIKCRLKKQPGKKSYEEDMQKVLAEEELNLSASLITYILNLVNTGFVLNLSIISSI